MPNVRARAFGSAVLTVVCAACSESPEEYAARDAQYQIAKKECSDAAAKKAVGGAGAFTKEKADLAMVETIACLRARGFSVGAK
jgi:hypothetical protein